MKSHMENPSHCWKTLCGRLRGDIGNFHPIVHKYGSSDTTCKMCQRLHAQDMAKAKAHNNCTKCRLSDPDNDYVCSIGHAQTTTTNDQGQIVKVGYYACELACPDFKLCGGDSQ